MTRKVIKRKRRGWILFLISLAALLVLLSIGKRGFFQQFRVRQEQKRLQNEIVDLGKKQAELEKQIRTLNDPDTIERIAREEYGMAKENEKVYHIVPEEKEGTEHVE